MHWNDLIEKLMTQNGGSASLSYLYQNAGRYRKLPTSDWQKTLRGVLYREVRRGRFIRAGLGVYAVSAFPTEASAYSSAVQRTPAQEFIATNRDPHSTVEGMLIELGNFHDFLTYTADRKKDFDAKSLGSLATLEKIPEFTYPELTKLVGRIDVVWFSKSSRLPFPKYVHEVEHTGDLTNSLVKMSRLRNFDARFVLAAWASKQAVFDDLMDQEAFSELKGRFVFRGFELVSQLYFSAVEYFELRSRYFGD